MQKTRVVREFLVYDTSGKLLFTGDSAKAVVKQFKMADSSRIYKFRNTGKCFRPNKDADYKVRMELRKRTETFEVEIKKRVKKPKPVKEKPVRGLMSRDLRPIPGEIWKVIPEPGFGDHNYCSNLGRAKYVAPDGKEYEHVYYKSKNKTRRVYYDIFLRCPGKKSMRVRLHRAIAKAFLDPTFSLRTSKGGDDVIDHIDNNSENNSLANIRICTRSENQRAARNMGITFGKKSCSKCYAEKDGVRKEFESTIDLAEFLTGKRNGGYFHAAYNRKRKKGGRPRLKGWYIGLVE